MLDVTDPADFANTEPLDRLVTTYQACAQLVGIGRGVSGASIALTVLSSRETECRKRIWRHF